MAWTPAKDEPHTSETVIEPQDRHGIQQHVDMITGQALDTINGQSPEGTTEKAEDAHTGIQGDRHGIAALSAEKERQGTDAPHV